MNLSGLNYSKIYMNVTYVKNVFKEWIYYHLKKFLNSACHINHVKLLMLNFSILRELDVRSSASIFFFLRLFWLVVVH